MEAGGGGGNETQGGGLEDTKQGLILGALFFEKGVPRKGVQKVFELIGTDCSIFQIVKWNYNLQTETWG